jgi:lincosamide nucleotidyltransferase A/C/D/E
LWISGGWGIDALVGKQTRPHNDIDIFIQRKDTKRLLEMLISDGYQEVKMDYTTDDHTVWQDSDNRIIDLHLFELVEDGNLRFNGDVYPFDLFSGKGTIGGIVVNCLTVEAQLLYHTGYELQEKDKEDVRLLCESFGVVVPEECQKI